MEWHFLKKEYIPLTVSTQISFSFIVTDSFSENSKFIHLYMYHLVLTSLPKNIK